MRISKSMALEIVDISINSFIVRSFLLSKIENPSFECSYALTQISRFALLRLYAIFFILPVALLFIAVGLLCGSVFNTKQVGGICGALFTNLAAWLSGIWFDLNLVGGVFKKIAYALPFVHAVELERAVLDGNWTNVFPHLLWVLGYGVAISGIAVLLFLRQMKRQ